MYVNFTALLSYLFGNFLIEYELTNENLPIDWPKLVEPCIKTQLLTITIIRVD